MNDIKRQIEYFNDRGIDVSKRNKWEIKKMYCLVHDYRYNIDYVTELSHTEITQQVISSKSSRKPIAVMGNAITEHTELPVAMRSSIRCTHPTIDTLHMFSGGKVGIKIMPTMRRHDYDGDTMYVASNTTPKLQRGLSLRDNVSDINPNNYINNGELDLLGFSKDLRSNLKCEGRKNGK